MGRRPSVTLREDDGDRRHRQRLRQRRDAAQLGRGLSDALRRPRSMKNADGHLSTDVRTVMRRIA